MIQRASIFFVFLLSYTSFTYAQVNESLAFEQAKLRMLCEAIRFNYQYQGQAAYVKTLDCRSLKALGKSIPSRFKSSTRLYKTYAARTYSQLPDLESRLEKLQKDLIAELEGIGQVAHGNNNKKLQEWNSALLRLNREFENIRTSAIRQYLSPESEIDMSSQKEETSGEVTSLQQIEVPAPVESYSPLQKEEVPHGHHGLWIIAILSAFVALAAAGTAYVIHVRSKSEIAALREMLYERYNLLDRRFDLFYKQLSGQEQQKSPEAPSRDEHDTPPPTDS
ncbi:MAG: hypothetical protein KatS3mg033_1968 [Thermonema sp.]|uniref:hypothetical protein n=1 Tax=Thermonema sp. TaxID=2231181 RepID=UPI0021DE6974|nr:hypothetical protein [Thermonema sp.]GIV40168.1 MAG: hypothetical protein KatS3mg033_1968 [Thermonema sp.]